jgi:hypothetical protein
MRRGDWLQTATGRQFWPCDPRSEEIDPRDIAHSLSMQVRYTGHAPEPYTIAQHCVLVSKRAESLAQRSGQNGTANMIARWGLVHDATEAYVVDVPRPLKPFLTNYREIEDAVMVAICQRFGLPLEMPAEVKQADEEALATEAAHFFPVEDRPAPWRLSHEPLLVIEGPAPVDFFPVWSHGQARLEYMTRWRELGMEVA